MQLEPSIQDTRVMLLQQVPLIDECAVKAKLLEAGHRVICLDNQEFTVPMPWCRGAVMQC